MRGSAKTNASAKILCGDVTGCFPLKMKEARRCEQQLVLHSLVSPTILKSGEGCRTGNKVRSR